MQTPFEHLVANLSYTVLKPYILYRVKKLMPRMHYELDDSIDLKRKEPFLLIGNHQYEVDWAVIGTIWKNKPSPVLSRSLVIDKLTQFKFKFLASGLLKAQGEKQLKIIKEIAKTIRYGWPVLLFPEGEVTHFGESRSIEPSVAKLIKMLNVDVIVALSKGGFMSLPRWGTSYRKNREVIVEMKQVLSKEEIKNLPIDVIHKTIEQAIYINDFDDQRTRKRIIGGEKIAEGVEDYLYVCPQCDKIHTLTTSGNEIICTSCDHRFHINEYGFIENSPFDNLVEWNAYQMKFIPALKSTEFSTKAQKFAIHYEKSLTTFLEEILLTYKNNTLILSGSNPVTIPVQELQYFNLTQRNALTFSYKNEHYFLRVEQFPYSFQQVCN